MEGWVLERERETLRAAWRVGRLKSLREPCWCPFPWEGLCFLSPFGAGACLMDGALITDYATRVYSPLFFSFSLLPVWIKKNLPHPYGGLGPCHEGSRPEVRWGDGAQWWGKKTFYLNDKTRPFSSVCPEFESNITLYLKLNFTPIC